MVISISTDRRDAYDHFLSALDSIRLCRFRAELARLVFVSIDSCSIAYDRSSLVFVLPVLPT